MGTDGDGSDDDDLVSRLRALPAPPPPSWALDERSLPRVVAAVDVAWGKERTEGSGEREVAVACCVAFALPDLACPLFVEFEPPRGVSSGPFSPYVPGKLFEREGRLLVPLARRVFDRAEGRGEGDRRRPLFPSVDLLLVDGFGELHPRRFGSACALGVAAGGVPTAGVAKSALVLSGGEDGSASSPSDKEARRGAAATAAKKEGDESATETPPPSAPGMETWYLGDDGSGSPMAVAVRPRGREGGGGSGGGRCAFVSSGHRVPLDAAARAVLACYDAKRRFRLPEPSRAADRLARERLRSELEGRR